MRMRLRDLLPEEIKADPPPRTRPWAKPTQANGTLRKRVLAALAQPFFDGMPTAGAITELVERDGGPKVRENGVYVTLRGLEQLGVVRSFPVRGRVLGWVKVPIDDGR